MEVIIEQRCIEIIKLLELNCGAYNLKLDGIPVWWFIRTHFYYKLLDQLRENLGQKKIGHSRRLSIREFIFSYKKILVFFIRAVIGFIRMLRYIIEKKEILFLMYPASSDIVKKGIENNVPLGRIYQRLKEHSIVVETLSLKSNDIYSLLFYKNVIFIDCIFFISFIKKFFKLFKPTKIDNWESFEKKINETNFEHVSSKWISFIAKELILSFKHKIILQIESARILLNYFKPKVIVETTSYNSGTLAFNFIAKEMGIYVVEIQHGLIPKFEIGYTYFIPYYYVNKKPLPDKLLLYGEAFKENILKAGNGFLDQNLVVTGYLRMNEFLSKINTDKKNIKFRVRNKLGIKNEVFLITFTSQPILNIFLIQFLEKIIPLLGKEIFICIKLHPLENEKELDYKKLLPSSTIKIVKNQVDLYDLLIASDVHVTICSTVFLEAMNLGVPNIILKLPGYEGVIRSMNHKDLIILDSPDDFVNEITHLKNDHIYRRAIVKRGKQISKRFFTDFKDTEKLIIKEITKIL
jgi:UDP-N-acetylglucosamine:LPS N-acetylglucosamine transferase